MRRRSRKRGFPLWPVALLALAGGSGLLGEEVYLRVKGWAAERLIGRALAAHLEDGAAHRPWSWADHHPLAELRAPRLGVRRTVIAGATGPSLAFAAGHVDGTALPGDAGNCAVAGHRDGAFRFLRRLAIGDRIELVHHGGATAYTVAEIRVLDKEDVWVLEPSAADRLTLITCHPFGALTSGPERFVVRCARSG